MEKKKRKTETLPNAASDAEKLPGEVVTFPSPFIFPIEANFFLSSESLGQVPGCFYSTVVSTTPDYPIETIHDRGWSSGGCT